MTGLSLIDWRAVGFGALWITGLALALTTLGFADHEAARRKGVRAREVLGTPGYQAALNAGLALFSLGLLGTAQAWWERGLWGLLAAGFASFGWGSLRQRRSVQTHAELLERVPAGAGSGGLDRGVGVERSRSSRPGRVDILGVGVSPIGMGKAVELILEWVQAGRREYVCLAPVHAIMACRRSTELRRIYNASGMTAPDGMPVVWLLRARGHRQVGRVYGPDLMRFLLRAGLTLPLRHYFYGGSPEVLQQLVARLAEQYPGLAIAGSCSPPFRPLTAEEDRAAVQAINRAQPEVVWVGLGSPKQERWMAEHREALEAPVLIGVGAAFDFLSGSKAQAPRWMQRSGLEWFFRLLSEPRRLWRRYLLGNPGFVALVVAESLRNGRLGREPSRPGKSGGAADG